MSLTTPGGIRDSTSRTHLTNEQLEKILSGCRTNCRVSQKELYNNYYGYAMSIALRYSSSHDNAVEMINDAFLKIFTQVKNFTTRYDNTLASFTAWLRKVIIYSCIDHLRKYNKNPLNESIEIGHSVSSGASENAEDILQFKEIIKCVQQLSPVYRAVFNLYVIEGFSHAEIAEKLSISDGASKSNLYKAKQNLQRLLRKRHMVNYETNFC